MSDSEALQHLQKLKSRLSLTQIKSREMSAVDKVEKLEEALSIFRTEVDMKLKIMQQILTTRNEQVVVQKKLLDQEKTLYDTLLVHWSNIPKLAATGLLINFSEPINVDASFKKRKTMDLEADEVDKEHYVEQMDNNSDPDYSEGDDITFNPNPKKSRSSLRRQRKSAISTRNSMKEESAVDQCSKTSGDWTNGDEKRYPPVEIEIETTQDQNAGGGGVDNDFSELFDVGNSCFNEDDRGDREEDNEISIFPSSDLKSNTDQDTETTFGSVETPDGRKLELKLPQRLIYQLRSTTKERTMIGHILRHYYSISYLRSCTLTGGSKRAHDGDGTTVKQKNALSPDMVVLIQGALRKFLPPTKSPNTEEGRRLTLVQKQRVRVIITSLLQYYKDLYNDDGSMKSRTKRRPKSFKAKV